MGLTDIRISVITPTCDRPVGFRLAEHFMARQTRQPDEWIVGDGGRVPAVCARGQQHLHQPSASGSKNFANNLLRALAAVTGDVVVIWEDDDCYRADHLECLVGRLLRDGAEIAGDDDQRYYNLAHRCWRTFANKGGCLCQTAFRRSLVPQFQRVIHECLRRSSYGVDTTFWTSVPRTAWSLAHDHTVLGLKGLPGQVGLGIGHRPDRHWTADPDFAKLREWIGDEDLAIYASLLASSDIRPIAS